MKKDDTQKPVQDDQPVQDAPVDDAKQSAPTNEDQINEWKQKYLRALADYQNIVKFSGEQIAETRRYAAADVITSFLDVLDTLVKAQDHLKDAGLGLAIKGFETALAGYQVKKLDVTGKQFDPGEMECIEVVQGDKDNMVVEELRPGYTMGDKILRVAQVKVSKKNIKEVLPA